MCVPTTPEVTGPEWTPTRTRTWAVEPAAGAQRTSEQKLGI